MIAYFTFVWISSKYFCIYHFRILFYISSTVINSGKNFLFCYSDFAEPDKKLVSTIKGHFKTLNRRVIYTRKYLWFNRKSGFSFSLKCRKMPRFVPSFDCDKKFSVSSYLSAKMFLFVYFLTGKLSVARSGM